MAKTSLDNISANGCADFFANPVLNSPYEAPSKYWKLSSDGLPSNEIVQGRRQSEYVSPVAQVKGTFVDSSQQSLDLNKNEEYETYSLINRVRAEVSIWREYSEESKWNVTPETAQLLRYWRTHKFSNQRPFFCQIEAVEVLIWLIEVAPKIKEWKPILKQIEEGNARSNPELFRIALKLATGAGKTTVMAMIIAWQVINATRYPSSDKFSRAFLVIAPGITIKDRLRVLNPSDFDEYYFSRELVPQSLKPELQKAKIVITNYHAFQLRDRQPLATGTKNLLKGRHGESAPIIGTETPGEMLARVVPELLNEKNILVINDEAHHCYREKPLEENYDVDALSSDEEKDARERNDAARVWISGIEFLKARCKNLLVVDLSATPFFLRGSGYREGTLFPWTVSDFSIMDAIESGIVKLPRVPISDNALENFPVFRNLWENVKNELPRAGARKSAPATPDNFPPVLCNAIEMLYEQYAKTFKLWEKANMLFPPCFIFVCQNTAISKLVYDYVSGYRREGQDLPVPAKCSLFSNFDEHGNELDRPRTILVDSNQLENGELSDEFKNAASAEIEIYKREIRERSGSGVNTDKIPDSEILREVMNTVGKQGKLGEQIRCVVSVSMLTEGWDANNVTHILGLRAFGTQLICEQVVGRALRRSSYELDDQGLFPAEYADVFGVPFSFIGGGGGSAPQQPPQITIVRAVSPERDASEISFPHISGYSKLLKSEKLIAKFDEHSHTFNLDQTIVGPCKTIIAPVVGKTETITPEKLKDYRENAIAYLLSWHLLQKYFCDDDGNPKLYLFGQLKKIVSSWLQNYLKCSGGTVPAQILYPSLADQACGFIYNAIESGTDGDETITAIVNPYNPLGSTRFVHFPTRKHGDNLFATSQKCHINFAVLDSQMERDMCKILENCPHVKAWVKNHNLGFSIPYTFGSERHDYIPDFIARLENGVLLLIETKGYDSPAERAKFDAAKNFWIPGVNARKTFGKWAFEKFGPYAEFSKYADMERDFYERIKLIF